MTQGYFAEPEPVHDALEIPPSALAIGAHPDDAEFGAGGTLARWAESGCEVRLLVITDGSKGTWDHSLEPADLIRIRHNEQRQAATVLGASGTVMLDHRDGELEYTMALREELCSWIRRLRPTVVLTHDPWRRYMLHPDHRAAGWAALDAVVAARDHLFFPDQLAEGLTEHRPEAVLLWAADRPDHWEDIADTFDRKVEALLCHSSQGASTMAVSPDNDESRREFAGRLRKWAGRMGQPVGLEWAEAFKMIRP